MPSIQAAGRLPIIGSYALSFSISGIVLPFATLVLHITPQESDSPA